MAVWLQGGQVAVQMQGKRGQSSWVSAQKLRQKLCADRGLEGNSRAQIAGLGETDALWVAGFGLTAAVGARLCNEQARSDRDCGRTKRGRGTGKRAGSGEVVAGFGFTGAV